MSFRGGERRECYALKFCLFFQHSSGKPGPAGPSAERPAERVSGMLSHTKWISFGARFIKTLSYDYS